MTGAQPAVVSPCISVCRMQEATGWCEGCLRTLDEIATWGQLDDAAKRAILLRLRPRRQARRAVQGVPAHALPVLHAQPGQPAASISPGPDGPAAPLTSQGAA